MRRYELMLVIRPDVADDKSQALVDRTTREIVASGGQIVKVAPWGRRRLAYPIDRHREGSYHIILFEAPSDGDRRARAHPAHHRRGAPPPRHPRRAAGQGIGAATARRLDDIDGDDLPSGLDEEDEDDPRRIHRRVRERGGSGRHRLTGGHDMAFCKVMIIGNLGRDPEMRYTPNGKPVTQFSVAVNQSTKNQQTGEWIEETDWFRVSVFGDRAERAAEQLRKGNRVFVEGRFRTREFEGKDGQKRTSLDVTADNVISLEKRAARRRGRLHRCPVRGRRGLRRLLRRRRRRRRWRFPPARRRHRPRRPSFLIRRDPNTCLPPSDPRSATTSTAIDADARSARSAPTRPSRSTTRRSTASAATCPSGPRSSRAARPAPAPATSASWPSPSSAPATSRCSRTHRSTSDPEPRRSPLSADARTA